MPRVSDVIRLLAAAVLPLHSYAASNMTGYDPCDALIQAGLGNRVLFATDPEYEPRIETYWALNTRLHPWCLVQPENTAEVSTAVTALLGAGDGAGDWHIAVRSGGHHLAYTNNIDHGVTIDLGKMDQAVYDNETNIANIGPGGRWKNVYAELHKQGVLVTGGRDGDVGVGGFLLGGGLTYFMGRQGFGVDSVKNFEVVLANGTVVNANSEENSDLWKALKGGGNNFGIVTRFDMEALPDKELAYGIRIMAANYSSELVDALSHFTDHFQEFDDDALVGLLQHNSSTDLDVMMAAIHVNTQGIHNSSGFEKLNQIPPLVPDETQSMSLAAAAEDSQLPGNKWSAGATLSFKNDKRILNRAVELHNKFVQDLIAALGPKTFDTIVFLQPLCKFFGDLSNKRGGNMLGIDAQPHNAIVWTGAVMVKSDQKALALAQTRMMAMLAELRSYAASLSGGNKLLFMNYADASQDALGSYGKANVEHIRSVAAKYDPTGAFQTRIPGGFKISRVDV
ncbi:FAD binding domain-containing protein [Lasiodiplodia theobromae]|uniref:uncharacterized protein n=1 Tax=Lasiodiplodia theobromae TaxID=45133 RepID=UPI0015C3BE81|nr:uncharacterized protein LTHEOB_7146 [Lasiodiplodia theobromae]KAF4542892.1 hypothetical protein LTHEOB_7146 [Lasiodiplodia theobromae]KAF9633914.1 FAD binding domain-containing protein [Lasiodiplodia theobromae]